MGMVADVSMDDLYRLADRGRVIFRCIRARNIRRGEWRDEYESSASHLAMTCDSCLRQAEASPADLETLATREASRNGWMSST
jgi:hypothetical protein